MVIDFSIINIAFEATLFVLFLIRGIGMLKQYLIPALKQHQQDINEKRFDLQEQHAILIVNKKQLATQFLQQEKQIALLTAKLETWYKMWENKQKQRKEFFEKQAVAIAAHQTEQEQAIAERHAASEVGRKMVAKMLTTLESDQKLKKSYNSVALKNLSGLKKRDAS